jgi:hypothetical protein
VLGRGSCVIARQEETRYTFFFKGRSAYRRPTEGKPPLLAPVARSL